MATLPPPPLATDSLDTHEPEAAAFLVLCDDQGRALLGDAVPDGFGALRWELTAGRHSVGRDPARCVVVLPDMSVSGHHGDLQVQPTSRIASFTDVGSSQGSRVARYDTGQRTSLFRSKARSVQHGDVLRLGSVRLRFVWFDMDLPALLPEAPRAAAIAQSLNVDSDDDDEAPVVVVAEALRTQPTHQGTPGTAAAAADPEATQSAAAPPQQHESSTRTPATAMRDGEDNIPWPHEREEEVAHVRATLDYNPPTLEPDARQGRVSFAASVGAAAAAYDDDQPLPPSPVQQQPPVATLTLRPSLAVQDVEAGEAGPETAEMLDADTLAPDYGADEEDEEEDVQLDDSGEAFDESNPAPRAMPIRASMSSGSLGRAAQDALNSAATRLAAGATLATLEAPGNDSETEDETESDDGRQEAASPLERKEAIQTEEDAGATKGRRGGRGASSRTSRKQEVQAGDEEEEDAGATKGRRGGRGASSRTSRKQEVQADDDDDDDDDDNDDNAGATKVRRGGRGASSRTSRKQKVQEEDDDDDDDDNDDDEDEEEQEEDNVRATKVQRTASSRARKTPRQQQASHDTNDDDSSTGSRPVRASTSTRSRRGAVKRRADDGEASTAPSSSSSSARARKTAGTPSKRAKAAAAAVEVAFSGMATPDDAETTLERFGAKLASTVTQGTFVVLPANISRTAKFLTAMSIGYPVKESWVAASVSEGKPADPARHWATDRAAARKYGFTVSAAMQKRQDRSDEAVMDGLRVVRLPGCKMPAADLRAVVEAAGASWLAKLPAAADSSVVVVGAASDITPRKRTALVAAGFTVWPLEAVLATVCRQERAFGGESGIEPLWRGRFDVPGEESSVETTTAASAKRPAPRSRRKRK